jgi:hypothetical protein
MAAEAGLRHLTGLTVAGCGVAIAATSIRANSWWGPAEITACVIPTANRFYLQDGDRWTGSADSL